MQDFTDVMVQEGERVESRYDAGNVWHIWFGQWVGTIVRQGGDEEFLGVLVKVDAAPDPTPNIVFRAEIVVAGFDVQIRRFDISVRGATKPIVNPGQEFTGAYRGSFALVPPGVPRMCSFVIGQDYINAAGVRSPVEWRALMFA